MTPATVTAGEGARLSAPLALLAVTQPSHGLRAALALVHVAHWGDVPTWLAFTAAGFGVWVALRQFARQTRQLERTQADQVDVRLRDGGSLPPGMPARHEQGPDPYNENPDSCYMAVVTNNSERPIRTATCRLETPGQGSHAATRTCEVIDWGSGARVARYSFKDVCDRDHRDLIRAHNAGGFMFAFRKEDHPDAKVTALFTDDSGVDRYPVGYSASSGARRRTDRDRRFYRP